MRHWFRAIAKAYLVLHGPALPPKAGLVAPGVLRTTVQAVKFPGVLGLMGVWLLLSAAVTLAADDPPALNPFGPAKTEREDAIPGYIETSDGKIYPGAVYMTREKRIKIYDEKMERQRELPLRVVAQLQGAVKKEWMERDWKFKETALDEKMYTGKSYPARMCVYTISLKNGSSITGELAEVFYVRAYMENKPGEEPDEDSLQEKRFFLHKRQKGENGTTLKSLVYVKTIKLGEEALKEGKEKAAELAKRAKAKKGEDKDDEVKEDKGKAKAKAKPKSKGKEKKEAEDEK